MLGDSLVDKREVVFIEHLLSSMCYIFYMGTFFQGGILGVDIGK